MKKTFSEYVNATLVINPEPENLFSDNGQIFHNELNIDINFFEEIVSETLKINGINRYHFCCNGNGVMYYQ